MAVKVETRVSSKFRTVLPAEVRKKFNVEPGDEVVWTVIGDEIFVRFRKSARDLLSNIIGAFPTKTKADATGEIDAVVYDRR